MAKFGKRHAKRIGDQTKQIRPYLSDPKFKARMAQINSIPIIRKFDVPYVAGYSEDARRIYFDRHFNTKWKGVDITKFIRIHEWSEKAFLDLFSFDYMQAHKFALHLERMAVKAAGLDWDAYQDHIEPYIKKIGHEQVNVVPPDLDLEPYADEHDMKLLRTLRKKEKSERKMLGETKISLEYHDELNPKLWVGDKLKPDVREKLLMFADSWTNFAKIPKDIVTDVIMTGGNANYNYTPKSDIDVHVVIDRNALGPNREFVDEYLQDKKVLWTLTHKISVLGYAIEPYAQDNADRYPANQGVYSLARDRWIQFPNKGDYNFQDDPGLKRKVMFYKKIIDDVIRNKMDIHSVKELKSKLRNMRAAAISAGGEFSFENLVFKELRNRGYLDRLNKYEQMLKDRELSL
jgi:hypothetical protein